VRAAIRGRPPQPLRPAAADYASARAAALEARLDRLTRVRWWVVGLPLVVAVGGTILAIVSRSLPGGSYAVYGVGLLVLNNPMLIRRRLAPARTAVAANRQPTAQIATA
jgi:hypothetical protein